VKEDSVAEQERPSRSPELLLKHSEWTTNLYACFIIDSLCAAMDYGSQPVVRNDQFLTRGQGIPRKLSAAILWISRER
jgi:hypothetical protein